MIIFQFPQVIIVANKIRNKDTDSGIIAWKKDKRSNTNLSLL